ncbi:hypothetical protein AO391_25520 [Pseudomonas marginalis ICMP 9505]|nr:hypothetical protein AO391_25520 [Pseudomonas marginalis ICMP 9505]
MACYRIYDKNRKPIGHLCGDLGPHCAECGAVGTQLCDYPVGDGKTCDRPVCEFHAAEVAPNVDYCPSHHTEWKAFRDAGGVKRELENVVPFKGA